MKNNYRKVNSALSTMAFIIMPFVLMAGGSKPQSSFNQSMVWMSENIILILGAIVVFGAAFTLWNIMDSAMDLQQRNLAKAKGLELDQESGKSKQSFWSSLSNRAWKLVPMEKEGDIDLGHDYDGIRELDNSLPPWWLYLFYGSILFAMAYFYIYTLSDIGVNQKQEYEAAIKQAEVQKREFLRMQADVVDESNVTVLIDPASIAQGQSIYLTNCASCHGNEGQGGIGPNMTDNYWIHGGSISDVFKTIKYGVPEKGMIAWNTQLKPTTIQSVSSYILTLVGTDPPNPKEKQGELYVPDNKVLQADVDVSKQ